MNNQNQEKNKSGLSARCREAEEIFAEVSLFDVEGGSGESADCGCFSCDGNPCVKIYQ